MKLYLDTSALVKLVQHEAESTALRRYLRRYRDDEHVTSALARTELVRAVGAAGPDAIAHARRLLGRLYLVSLDVSLLDAAGTFALGAQLRSLDAIHLCSAQLLGMDLRTVVTYDARMVQAAAAAGMSALAPA